MPQLSLRGPVWAPSFCIRVYHLSLCPQGLRSPHRVWAMAPRRPRPALRAPGGLPHPDQLAGCACCGGELRVAAGVRCFGCDGRIHPTCMSSVVRCIKCLPVLSLAASSGSALAGLAAAPSSAATVGASPLVDAVVAAAPAASTLMVSAAKRTRIDHPVVVYSNKGDRELALAAAASAASREAAKQAYLCDKHSASGAGSVGSNLNTWYTFVRKHRLR